jgi:nucleotide-binding universal stress UspA family protein
MTRILVGLDGSAPGERALAHAKALARLIGDCELILVYVIEWSPYEFHTPQELEERHQRREKELAQAHGHILEPAKKATEAEGFRVETVVRHGDPATILEELAVDKSAAQIVIGRTGHRGLRERLFGGVSGKLIAAATVPVTIIPETGAVQ